MLNSVDFKLLTFILTILISNDIQLNYISVFLPPYHPDHVFFCWNKTEKYHPLSCIALLLRLGGAQLRFADDFFDINELAVWSTD